MIPNELEEKYLTLPYTDSHTIVIVTGKKLRHQRFAHRILNEFGEQVVAWYELDEHTSSLEKSTGHHQDKEQLTSTPSKLRKIQDLLTKEFPEYLSRYGISATLKKMFGLFSDVYYKLFFLRNVAKRMAKSEQKLFAQEVAAYARTATLKPIKIHPDDVHGEPFIQTIKTLDPYFFLTLSGPLYREPLLKTIRGAAINQHAGHSPLLKGSNTIHWALYHRELKHVSSTVHITTTGADAGQILRRSNPCLFPGDDVETVFLRTVALGTELMIESVHQIMADKKITVFNQPQFSGKTYLNKEYSLPIAKSLIRDFRAGWLKDALNAQRNF